MYGLMDVLGVEEGGGEAVELGGGADGFGGGVGHGGRVELGVCGWCGGGEYSLMLEPVYVFASCRSGGDGVE